MADEEAEEWNEEDGCCRCRLELELDDEEVVRDRY